MLGAEQLGPDFISRPAPTDGRGALPITPVEYPVAARRQAHVLGFAGLRFKRAIIAKRPDGEIVGRSQIERNVAAFVYAPTATSPARKLTIGSAPLPTSLEGGLRVWVVAMMVCDPLLEKPACELAMLNICRALKAGAPPQTFSIGSLRCEAEWIPNTVISLSLTKG